MLMRRLALAALLLLPGCAKRLQRRLVAPSDVASLDGRSPFLKAHLKSGAVVIFQKWKVSELAQEVTGTGIRYDVDRLPGPRGLQLVPIAEVAIFETNVAKNSPSVGVLAVVSGLSAAVTVACLANPKSCFGSCPTFYTEAGGAGPVLMAEGFSDSVAPSLEATDVDALWSARPAGRRLTVTMTNEALETHVVRHVEVLAAARAPGQRVLAMADGSYRVAHALAAPVTCADCLDAVRALDGEERVSTTDGVDLAAREDIDLEFAAPGAGPHALVIGSRQTLLSTYVFYQALAFVGDDIGALLAALERRTPGGQRPDAGGVRALLGTIEVQVPDGAGWRTVGRLGETGPLATDVRALELPAGAGSRVRLHLARGHWRLDWVALASLGGTVTPVRVAPRRVLTDVARRGRGMLTLPGDRVVFEFELPAGEPELFLESRGYYLEWMREEWLRERNPARAAQLMLAPARALRDMAPAFRRLEPDMERLFWRSRFRRGARLPSGPGVAVRP